MTESIHDEMTITVGTEWQHYKHQSLYKILHFANTHGDRWEWMVVYIDEKAQVWARPVTEWTLRYEPVKKGTGDF
jgi:hypothetical protein